MEGRERFSEVTVKDGGFESVRRRGFGLGFAIFVQQCLLQGRAKKMRLVYFIKT